MSIVISQNLYLAAASGSALPLTHARIGYQSHLTASVISSSESGDTGYPLDNILTTQTFEVFKSTTTNGTVISIDLLSAKAVDYIAMVGKNISTYLLYYSIDGITYTKISELNDSSKVSKMGLFEETTARYWRLAILGDTNGFNIANLKLGLSLAMYRPIYGGHAPLTLSRTTIKKPNISEGGEFLGSTVIRKGLNTSYDYQHLPADWYRQYFDPFVQHVESGNTFYMAWRPEDYPLEVGYCLSNSEITPSNMGVRDLMQVNFSVVGYDVS